MYLLWLAGRSLITYLSPESTSLTKRGERTTVRPIEYVNDQRVEASYDYRITEAFHMCSQANGLAQPLNCLSIFRKMPVPRKCDTSSESHFFPNNVIYMTAHHAEHRDTIADE